jgi:hypothetical protein
MALQLRRGTNAQRALLTLKQGELVFVTDYTTASVAPLWIGDGITVGGVVASSNTLGGLTDINVATKAEGDILYYDATTSKWRNTPILSIKDNAVAIDINSTANSQFNMNTAFTLAPASPLVLRHTTSGTPVVGFGTLAIQRNDWSFDW